jgi:hypothetical protein
MTDITLRTGQANSSDIALGDPLPTAAWLTDSGVTIVKGTSAIAVAMAMVVAEVPKAPAITSTMACAVAETTVIGGTLVYDLTAMPVRVAPPGLSSPSRFGFQADGGPQGPVRKVASSDLVSLAGLLPTATPAAFGYGQADANSLRRDATRVDHPIAPFVAPPIAAPTPLPPPELPQIVRVAKRSADNVEAPAYPVAAAPAATPTSLQSDPQPIVRPAKRSADNVAVPAYPYATVGITSTMACAIGETTVINGLLIYDPYARPVTTPGAAATPTPSQFGFESHGNIRTNARKPLSSDQVSLAGLLPTAAPSAFGFEAQGPAPTTRKPVLPSDQVSLAGLLPTVTPSAFGYGQQTGINRPFRNAKPVDHPVAPFVAAPVVAPLPVQSDSPQVMRPAKRSADNFAVLPYPYTTAGIASTLACAISETTIVSSVLVYDPYARPITSPTTPFTGPFVPAVLSIELKRQLAKFYLPTSFVFAIPDDSFGFDVFDQSLPLKRKVLSEPFAKPLAPPPPATATPSQFGFAFHEGFQRRPVKVIPDPLTGAVGLPVINAVNYTIASVYGETTAINGILVYDLKAGPVGPAPAVVAQPPRVFPEQPVPPKARPVVSADALATFVTPPTRVPAVLLDVWAPTRVRAQVGADILTQPPKAPAVVVTTPTQFGFQADEGSARKRQAAVFDNQLQPPKAPAIVVTTPSQFGFQADEGSRRKLRIATLDNPLQAPSVPSAVAATPSQFGFQAEDGARRNRTAPSSEPFAFVFGGVSLPVIAPIAISDGLPRRIIPLAGRNNDQPIIVPAIRQPSVIPDTTETPRRQRPRPQLDAFTTGMLPLGGIIYQVVYTASVTIGAYSGTVSIGYFGGDVSANAFGGDVTVHEV